MIFLKLFGSSSRNGEIMRSLKRGDLTVNVRNIQTVKGSRPIALSLDKPQTTRKVGNAMEIRSNEPLPIPMPIQSEQRQLSIGNVVRAELRGIGQAGLSARCAKRPDNNIVAQQRAL